MPTDRRLDDGQVNVQFREKVVCQGLRVQVGVH